MNKGGRTAAPKPGRDPEVNKSDRETAKKPGRTAAGAYDAYPAYAIPPR